MVACLRPSAALGLFTLTNHPYLGYAVALPVGLVGGLTSTLFGLGGGIVTVPGLTLLFGDVSFHAARATSLVTMMPTSSFGARHHYRLGTLDLGLVKQMMPTAVLGALIGVFAVNHIPPAPCRAAFAVVLLAVAVRLLMPARGGSRRERSASMARSPPRMRGPGVSWCAGSGAHDHGAEVARVIGAGNPDEDGVVLRPAPLVQAKRWCGKRIVRCSMADRWPRTVSSQRR
jgi:Sulfite exporter TauE/SafE